MISDQSPARLSYDRLILVLLIGLSIVPALAGAARLSLLASGAAATPETARFVEAPAPVIVHILSATGYALIGAFQFAPGHRRRRRSMHRMAGAALVPLGLAAAISGIWMTLFYDLPPEDGAFLNAVRLLVGVAMVVFLLFGVLSLLAGDPRRHGDYMMRAYALGLGAGTQVLVFAPVLIVSGMPGGLTRGLMMAAGWGINYLIAEWIIQRPRRVADPVN